MKYCLVTLAAMAASFPSTAEIYKYKDHDGYIVFSDKPLKKGYQLMWSSQSSEQISPYTPAGISRPGEKVALVSLSPQVPKSSQRIQKRGSKANKSKWNPVIYRQNVARYTPLINKAAIDSKLKPELLHALIKTESDYDASAVSKTGAVGLAQLMPDTAKRFGVKNIRNPRENVYAGARYLRELLEMFSFDLKLALAAYNAGENSVIKYGDKVPPYPETQRYVQKVLRYYTQNRMKSAGGQVAGNQPKMLGDIN